MAQREELVTKVTRITLCGVQGCCPTVEISHETGQAVITDDFGGRVTLTREEFRELTKVNPDLNQ